MTTIEPRLEPDDVTNDTSDYPCYCKICGNEFAYDDLEDIEFEEQVIGDEGHGGCYVGVCRPCEVDQ